MENFFSQLPSPWELIQDSASIVVISIFFILMITEEIAPGRKLPHIKFWRFKGVIAFILYFFLSTYLPLIWGKYLEEYSVFDLRLLGDYWGALVALLLYELGVYIWHRTMHQSNLLWRIFHQMHHSAERVDTYGAFFFSPMDMIGFTLLGSLTMVWFAGFTPYASIYALYGATFLAVFQHTNIKTPQWIGYIFQRPESHSLHHARGVHAYNYSDLPLFDIIFNTFKNPKDFSSKTGFYDGASKKITKMILFKDIYLDRN